jgi:putative serine protease PepD
MDSPSRASTPGARPARVAVVGAAALGIAAAAAACTSTSPRSTSSGSNTSPSALESQYETVVKDVLPSVVQITAGNSTGSGVVYDSKGDIVTNAHVIGSATTATVRLPSGTQVPARVVGVRASDDLAVIRVSSNASSLKAAQFANSSQVKVGEIVLAMGNPLGLTGSVTQGIVSATDRTVGESGSSTKITNAIQTSAAINPGNSGGALVNLSNQVVGIPTLAARLPDEGGAAPGIGFAIPSNDVRTIATQLIRTSTVARFSVRPSREGQRVAESLPELKAGS